jgi:hypothetical protein
LCKNLMKSPNVFQQSSVWFLFLAISFHKYVISFCLGMQFLSSGKSPRYQCDQFGQNFTIWANLRYFLLSQFSPKQAVSTQGLLQVFLGFKCGLVQMFLTFKLNFSVNIFGHFLPKLGTIFINFLVALRVKKHCTVLSKQRA